ncbi:MAG: hypothetical protein CR991_01280 [Proteobacteria bacterium]|nr:MAG: hypothetical protein CR991_01280 [Pseudomonadota bacterium]
MKKQMLVLSIAAALSGISVAQAEVTLFDYQEASSAYEEAYVTGSLNAGKSRDDAQTQYNLNVNAFYDRTISTPDRDFDYGGYLQGTVSRAGTKDAEKNDSYDVGANAAVFNYFQPGSNGAFWYGSVEAQDTDKFDKLKSSATVGLGYGRVVNATPMAKAMRIVEELAQRNLLAAKPSKSVYQELAKLISREDEYFSRYRNLPDNEYEARWLGDMEAVLLNAGVLKKSGAISTLSMRDVLFDENIFTRKIGWRVRAGVGYQFSDGYDGDNGDPSLEVVGEYHMPVGRYAQFSDEATLSTTLGDDKVFQFDNDLSYSYEVDDSLDWINGWKLSYNDDSEITKNTLTSEVVYELNSTLDLASGITVTNYDGSSDDGTDTSFHTSVRYRLR